MTSAAAPRSRNKAIDVLRGIVMVIMALDHARDFYAAGFRVSPTDLATTTPALFFTRWITHFCAPVFVFLAGTAAYLYGASRTPRELPRFLLSRGLWLVFLEVAVVRIGWTADLFYRSTPLQVIWAIGVSMVILAALCRLPLKVVALIGAALIAGHNALDGVSAEAFGRLGWLWKILHQGGALEPYKGHFVFVAYPLLPWPGVMAIGFAFGAWMKEPAEVRRRRTWLLGAGLTAAFLLIRGLNVYGDPHPWAPQESALFSVMSFLNCHKYPPSLCYLLMTLGPALALLAALDGAEGGRAGRALAIIGAVPLFYYVAHLFAMRITAAPLAYMRFGAEGLSPPPGHAGNPEYGLGAAYLGWALVVLALYPACRWFAAVKRRRRDWWLSYL